MLVYTFGYLPTGPFDLADEDIEGVAIPRTKSRAYKIAVWAGPWGAHQLIHWEAISIGRCCHRWQHFHPGWGSGQDCLWRSC